ncbi:MAG: hypothetical protein FWE18_05845 [Alphaproteobacteria bacterium]|nr:hypothetical protein [Alphaproteobacteria bacterium]
MRFLDLRFVVVISIIIIVLVITILFSLEKKYNLGLFRYLSFISKPDPNYKEACINYATDFLKVNYNLSAVATENNIKTAELSRQKIKPKERLSLADDRNEISTVIINMRISINNNSAFNLVCWINASFKEDPSLITSYDILFLNIYSINNTKSQFSVKEENY